MPIYTITKRVKAHCTLCDEIQRRFGSSSLSSSKSIAAIKLMTSLDTAETILLDEPEPYQCSICMESFAHNDLVSWSPSTECNHVFHHACIKTWLLHHECCPYCRVCLLSVDQRNVEITHSTTVSRGTTSSVGLLQGLRGYQSKKRVNNWGKEQLRELTMQRHRRLGSTYYCIKDGLVILDQPLRITNKSTIDYDIESNSTFDHKMNRTTDLSLQRAMKQFLVSDVVPPNEMIALRSHPKSIRSTSDVVVTITSSQNIGGMNTTVDDGIADDNAVIDIETTMKELPIISDDVIYRNEDAV